MFKKSSDSENLKFDEFRSIKSKIHGEGYSKLRLGGGQGKEEVSAPE